MVPKISFTSQFLPLPIPGVPDFLDTPRVLFTNKINFLASAMMMMMSETRC